MILHDMSYRAALGLAFAVHMVILLLLLGKFNFTTTKRSTVYTGNIIQAEIVNATTLTNAQLMSGEKKSILIKDKNITLPNIVNKNLLTEREHELLELKKDKQKHMRQITKQHQQQIAQLAQNQLVAEKQQLLASKQNQQLGTGNGVQGPLPGVLERHHEMVKHAIAIQWIKPDGMVVGDLCKLLVNVAPGGMVLDIKLLVSSGKEIFDRSAKEAVLKASPLPVPEDIRFFNEFRTMKLTFREDGIANN